jgi:predicted acetyltransferase
MSEIKLVPETDLDQMTRIVGNAYPAFTLNSQADRDQFRERMLAIHDDPHRAIYGLYRQGKLLGSMIIYDFEMNFQSHFIPAGGVGLVAVDLVHKKEKVAKEMIEFFVAHYLDRGAAMTLLYPFRPDFYRRMGYGYGTKMNHYRVRITALPRGRSKAGLRFLGPDDLPAMQALYQRCAGRTHGMIARNEWEWGRFQRSPALRLAGFERDGRLSGYLAFNFKEGSTFLENDLQVQELVYEDRDALLALMTFLHIQFDQVEWVVINSQDEYLHHLLGDPRSATGNLIPSVYHESNSQGVGLMYRVSDLPGIFRQLSGHNFGGQNCRLTIDLADSFWPQNAGRTTLHVRDGRADAVPDGPSDVTISLDVADFSSLLMGVVPFNRLYDYHLADISDPSYLETVSTLFRSAEKPVCLTAF